MSELTQSECEKLVAWARIGIYFGTLYPRMLLAGHNSLRGHACYLSDMPTDNDAATFASALVQWMANPNGEEEIARMTELYGGQEGMDRYKYEIISRMPSVFKGFQSDQTILPLPNKKVTT